MKKDLVEMVFILDGSGSMAGCENSTISGFNEMIESQKLLDGTANVTTIVFNTKNKVVHDRCNLNNVKKLTNEDYYACGGTALFDAVGSTVIDLNNKLLYDAPLSDYPNKVMVFITTDGMENSSKIYKKEQIKNLISHLQEKYDWEFVFLGANIDAFDTGAGLGFSIDNIVQLNSSEELSTRSYCVVKSRMDKVRRSRLNNG